MQPTRVLPAVSVLSLIGVEYGGWALLGFLTGRGQLGQFREQFFRAGHAHAGVLLILSLVYYLLSSSFCSLLELLGLSP